MPDLLIELLSEEIPASMQVRAAESLKSRMTEGLLEAGLVHAGAAAFATPRRLALSVNGLPNRSPDIREDRRGPRVDAPEKAVKGFLRGTGVGRGDLDVRDTPKGRFYFATIEKPGDATEEIVAKVLNECIRGFPWPKSMRWGSSQLRWARPLHAILCILASESGAHIVPVEIEGIKAGDTSVGHRFMAPEHFSVASFDDYVTKLKGSYVILSSADRAAHIWSEATNLSFASGLDLVDDRALLAEVAGLVEWPVVLMGAIDAEFLDLPPEVLQTSMREHQKFFSVRNRETGRIERFITVANRETVDQGATILAGNRKVLRARLADARFFWENDLRIAKSGMSVWERALDSAVFHGKLGSQRARVARIAALAADLAKMTGANPDTARQAARLAKLDLGSEMVLEFPELQGVMGSYYVAAAGFAPQVAAAAKEHYSPLGPSDEVPVAPVSVAVALADKLDTLTGFWAIDERPTGSKDPFALRRAALGVLRLILENELRMRLIDLFMVQFGRHRESIPSGSADMASLSSSLLDFILDRLKVFLRDQGIRHDIIDACVAMPGKDDPVLLTKRIRALSEMLGTDDGENVMRGFRRANNILRQEEKKDGVVYSSCVDPDLATSQSERDLLAALRIAGVALGKALEEEDFRAAMLAIAALRSPVDALFHDIQINAADPLLRRNRLNLLNQIRTVCTGVADLTRIGG